MGFTVFISHSTSDFSLVYQLKEWLEINGITAYLAELDPQYGESIADKVARAIDQSDCVIAFLTKDGARSRWVNQEIGYAEGVPKLVIPVAEEGVTVPGFLEGREYVPFTWDNPAEAIDKLIAYLAEKKADAEAQRAGLAALLFLGLGLLTLAAVSQEQAKRG